MSRMLPTVSTMRSDIVADLLAQGTDPDCEQLSLLHVARPDRHAPHTPGWTTERARKRRQHYREVCRLGCPAAGRGRGRCPGLAVHERPSRVRLLIGDTDKEGRSRWVTR